MNDAATAFAPWPPAFSDEFLRDARHLFDDGGHVMIVGPVGSNRGALSTAITGPSVPTAWGREAQAFGADGKRYAVVNQLFPNLRGRPDQSVDDVVHAVRTILSRTFGQPVVSLREADLCDQGSVDVLARLVEGQAIRLVSTVDPGTASMHRFARTAARIDLEPLDDPTIAHLLTARFGAVPHPTTVAMLAARSQGAYAVLKELADAGYQTGQIKAIAGSLVTDAAVSVDVVDDVADRAATTWSPRFAAHHPSRDVIDVAALALRLDLAEATAVFGHASVEGALGLGALRADGDRLTFGSRVEAMLMRRTLGVERRTELFARYFDGLARSATATGAAPRIAEWLLSIDRPLPPGLAVRATTEANRQGRYSLALRFAGSIDPGLRPSRLLIEQCHALSESGDQPGLESLLRSIDPAALDDDDLGPFARWAGRCLEPEEVEAGLRTALEATDPLDEARRAALRLVPLFAEAFQTGSEDARQSLRSLTTSGHLSGSSRVMALTAVAASLRQASLSDEAIETSTAAVDALATLDAPTCDVEATLETQILCYLSAADLEGARSALDVYSTPGVAFGNVGRLGTALWGLHAFFRGDLGSALAHAQICLAVTPASDPHRMRGWIEAVAAQILTQVGDIDGVYELLEASERRPPHPRRQLDLERRISQACVHDAIGQPEEALVLLQGVVDEAAAHGLTLAEVDAAVLCVQIGGPVHLRQLLRAVEPLDETSGTSWIWRRFAWLVRDNDMRGLVALAEELDTEGRALFAAEVAQFTLDIARRAADMTPDQRERLVTIADPMQHRHVTRAP